MAKEAGENHEESQDNRSSGRDLNSAAPECGAAVLTARPLRSIAYVWFPFWDSNEQFVFLREFQGVDVSIEKLIPVSIKKFPALYRTSTSITCSQKFPTASYYKPD